MGCMFGLNIFMHVVGSIGEKYASMHTGRCPLPRPHCEALAWWSIWLDTSHVTKTQIQIQDYKSTNTVACWSICQDVTSRIRARLFPTRWRHYSCVGTKHKARQMWSASTPVSSMRSSTTLVSSTPELPTLSSSTPVSEKVLIRTSIDNVLYILYYLQHLVQL